MKLPKVADSQGEFIVPEAGVYKMEFTTYDDPVLSTFKKDSGADSWRIKLVFTIHDEESEYDGVEIFAWYGWTMHPKGKLYPIVKALLGRDIEEDEEPDLDDLTGKFIMGTLDNVTKTGTDGTARTYANLIAASPVRRAKPKTGKAEPATPTPPVVNPDDDGPDWGDEDEDAA